MRREGSEYRDAVRRIWRHDDQRMLLFEDRKGGIEVMSSVSLQVGVTNLSGKSYVNHLNAKNPFTGAQLSELGRLLRNHDHFLTGR